MKIYPTDIVQASSELLKIIEKEKIETIEDLKGMMGKSITINPKDSIQFRKSPSNFGTTAYTTSYVRLGAGIPLEFKVNTRLDYTQIILKAQTNIKPYETFAIDPFNNKVQNRVIEPANLNIVKEELKRLNSIKDQ
jgi:hypothetical protein